MRIIQEGYIDGRCYEQQKAEEIKGSISRKNSSIVFADKQIQDNLKTVENTKNGIEVQEEKIKDAQLKIQLKQDEIKGIELNIEKEKSSPFFILDISK